MKFLRQNMLVQFSILSFLILLAIALASAFFISSKVEDNAIKEVVNHVKTDTGVILTKSLEPADLEAPMVGERYKQFDEMVQNFLISDLVAMVKVWDKDGSLIYSNDSSDIEEADDHNPQSAIRKCAKWNYFREYT